MSEEQGQGQATASEATADTQVEAKPEAGGAERTYTHSEYQAALNKVGSKEKKEGQKSGASARDSELLEKSGADSIDDLLAAFTSQQEIATELEGQEISDIKKQYKAQVKGISEERDRYKGALESLLKKEREDIPEHITEVLDEMPLDKQLAYIAKHREAISAEQKPRSVGRGSSPGSGSSLSASRAEVTPGLGRLRVAYETSSPT